MSSFFKGTVHPTFDQVLYESIFLWCYLFLELDPGLFCHTNLDPTIKLHHEKELKKLVHIRKTWSKVRRTIPLKRIIICIICITCIHFLVDPLQYKFISILRKHQSKRILCKNISVPPKWKINVICKKQNIT